MPVLQESWGQEGSRARGTVEVQSDGLNSGVLQAHSQFGSHYLKHISVVDSLSRNLLPLVPVSFHCALKLWKGSQCCQKQMHLQNTQRFTALLFSSSSRHWPSGPFSGHVSEDSETDPRPPVIVSLVVSLFPSVFPGGSSSINWSRLFGGMSSLPREELKLHVLLGRQLTTVCICTCLQKRSTVSVWIQIDPAGGLQKRQLQQVHT